MFLTNEKIPGQVNLSVSVIIPTYNRAAFIGAAVQSALDQTRTPDEIIVVDDGSTDETPEILAAFGAPVRMIHQENRGRSAARNAGLRAATSDAIVFLDSDDLLEPQFVERCAELLERHPDVGVAYTDFYLCDSEGNRVGRSSQVIPGRRSSGKVLGALARRNFMTVTAMVRRSCLGDITFEEEMSCAEDYDFWRKLAIGCGFQYIGEPLMRYRFHDAMTTMTQLDDLSRGQVLVQRRILDMPEFRELARSEQARAFCSHGAKLAILGATSEARQFFWKSIRTSPTYSVGFGLFVLSLLGRRTLQFAIHKQRQLSGNQMDSREGKITLFESGPSPRPTVMQNSTRHKVLVVGQTPPPYHGQAIMIQRLVDSELAGFELIHVRMGFSDNLDEVGRFRISKVFHLFAVIASILRHRLVERPKVLYYPPGGPHRVPMFRDIIILLSTRWMFDKTIFHFHASGLEKLYQRLPSWQRWLFRKAYFGVDAAVRISDLTPEDGKFIQAQREFVVPNGIEDPWQEMVPRDYLPASEEAPLKILYVGMLHEGKGVLVLAEACKYLAEREIPFQLQLMGQADSEEFVSRLRERIAELELENCVSFLGVLNGQQKLDAFAAADVLCHPTHYDTFPVVLLEAMAAGLPVVSTRFSGIPSIVQDGQTGTLVEPRDPSAVADALATLANQPYLRQEMGAAGRQRFKQHYTLSTHVERMRQVFLKVADEYSDSVVPSAPPIAPEWKLEGSRG